MPATPLSLLPYTHTAPMECSGGVWGAGRCRWTTTEVLCYAVLDCCCRCVAAANIVAATIAASTIGANVVAAILAAAIIAAYVARCYHCCCCYYCCCHYCCYAATAIAAAINGASIAAAGGGRGDDAGDVGRSGRGDDANRSCGNCDSNHPDGGTTDTAHPYVVVWATTQPNADASVCAPRAVVVSDVCVAVMAEAVEQCLAAEPARRCTPGSTADVASVGGEEGGTHITDLDAIEDWYAYVLAYTN